MDPLLMGSSLVYGAIGGAGWGLIGYANNKTKYENVKFELKYFAKSVLVGIGLGIYGVYSGVPIDTVAASAAAIPITAIVEKILTIIWNVGSAIKERLFG